MRLFGFTIIRSANHDAFVASNKVVKEEMWRLQRDIVMRLDSESSLRRTVTNHEETIEALKKKCSLVNVSALENEIRRLKNEALSGTELPPSDQLEFNILPGSLVQPSEGAAELGAGHRQEAGQGFDLVHDGEISGSDISEQTGDR